MKSASSLRRAAFAPNGESAACASARSSSAKARARALAEELRAEAHAALSAFGAKAARLRELADFIVLRRF